MDDRRQGGRAERATPAHGSALAHGLDLTIRQADAENAQLKAEVERLQAEVDRLRLPTLLLRDREVAELFGVTPHTIREWAKTGLLPRARIGNGPRPTVRFRMADIEALIARSLNPEEP